MEKKNHRIFNSTAISAVAHSTAESSALCEQPLREREKKNQKSNVKQIIPTDIYAEGCFSSPFDFFPVLAFIRINNNKADATHSEWCAP